MNKRLRSDSSTSAEKENAKLAAELVIANEEKAKLAAELVIANEEKANRATEVVIANAEKAKRAAELVIANSEKVKRAALLVIANLEKAKRADELTIANKELAVQNEAKVKLAAELVIADVNKTKLEAELLIAKIEKAKQIAKSIVANKELSFQTEEKSKRAAELVIADAEKSKLEAELVIANIKNAKHSAELVIANVEKAKRFAELVVSNKELVYQKSQKAKRAAELIIANVEKAKRAAELVIANIEKAKRAAELVITHKELVLATERAQLMEQLIILNKQLTGEIEKRKQTESELINAKEKAELSDRLKSAFLANMSHEIRTPMNGILGFAELLKEPELTGEEQKTYISIIEKSGERMLNIINDIISISKVESGLMEVAISETNVNEQLEYIYNFFKPEVEQKGLQIIVKNRLLAKDAIVKTDREKVYAIITNLTKNAIKFSHDGLIEIGCEKKGTCVEFFVKDAGIGILSEQKELIFDRFIQGKRPLNRIYKGTGLGLSISKAYVEMLGGRIWVESEEGKGSVFYFTIPCVEDQQEVKLVPKVDMREDEEVQIHDLKILIVDNDETSGLLITTALRNIIQDALHAKTGVEAVDACRNYPGINLVLMDIRMPVMDGYESTRQIRQFDKKVVIIAQTAYALMGDREKAFNAGCNDYTTKPLDIAHMKRLVQKHFKNQVKN